MENKQKNTVRAHLALFGNVRVLALSAMLAAMSVVLAVLAKAIFGTLPIRVTIENLPVLFSGIAFGPFIGGLVAVAADLLSCVIAGQAPAPLISVGAALMGLAAGVFGNFIFRRRNYPSMLAVALLTHAVGTIFAKSLALHIHFGYVWPALWPRIPLYLGIAVLESVLLYLLFRNKEISRGIERLYEA